MKCGLTSLGVAMAIYLTSTSKVWQNLPIECEKMNYCACSCLMRVVSILRNEKWPGITVFEDLPQRSICLSPTSELRDPFWSTTSKSRDHLVRFYLHIVDILGGCDLSHAKNCGCLTRPEHPRNLSLLTRRCVSIGLMRGDIGLSERLLSQPQVRKSVTGLVVREPCLRSCRLPHYLPHLQFG